MTLTLTRATIPTARANDNSSASVEAGLRALRDEGYLTWPLLRHIIKGHLDRGHIDVEDIRRIYALFGVKRTADTLPEDRFEILAAILRAAA